MVDLEQYAEDLVEDWPTLDDAAKTRLAALLRPWASTQQDWELTA